MDSSIRANKTQISAIFPFMGNYSLALNTIEHLRHQTIAGDMEVILVKESGYDAQIPSDWCEGFGAGRVLETEIFTSRSKAYAEGTIASQSEYVVFCEDHCFPEPQWAEALVSRLREGHAVVGATFYNSNPENVISWADLFLAYEQFVYADRSERRTYLPGHNSAYRKSILEALPDLDHQLEVEYVLHTGMSASGESLFLESAARTHHTNFATFRSWCHATYLVSHVFGDNRGERQSTFEKARFIALSFLIPPLRLWRVLPTLSRARKHHALPTTTPMYLLAAYCVSTYGEIKGMLFGAENIRPLLLDFEFNRIAHAPGAREALRQGKLRFY